MTSPTDIRKLLEAIDNPYGELYVIRDQGDKNCFFVITKEALDYAKQSGWFQVFWLGELEGKLTDTSILQGHEHRIITPQTLKDYEENSNNARDPDQAAEKFYLVHYFTNNGDQDDWGLYDVEEPDWDPEELAADEEDWD